MSKVFKKARKLYSQVDIGHKLTKGFGLPDPYGDLKHGDNKTLSPAEAAAKANEDNVKAQMAAAEIAAAEQRKANVQAQQLAEQAALTRANQQALSNQGTNDAVTKFELGGGGDAPADEFSDRRKRRRSGTGGNLSTQLGIV